MPRDRERVIAVDAAVDVGHRQVRLEDRRLEGHPASVRPRAEAPGHVFRGIVDSRPRPATIPL